MTASSRPADWRALLAHFHSDPVAMTHWAVGAKPSDYGAFAPLVLEAAKRGETGARAIGALSEAVEALGARRIAIVGGLAEPLREHMPADLVARLAQPLFDPVDGAILLAGGMPPPL